MKRQKPTSNKDSESNPIVYRGQPFRLAVLLIVVVVTGCAQQKSISKDELRSQLKAIHSTTSETMLFLGQIRAHKVNSSFAAAHLHYLHETNEKILRDLTGSSASSGVEALLADSHAWAEELSKTLAELSGSIDNPLIIESGAKRIDEIGQHAQHLEASF